MKREDLEKLLGGYATNTLSDAEQRELFAAALSDQDLFDKLAREQPLRELLQDPGARSRILEALGPARGGSERPRRAPLWRPWLLGFAAAAAAVLVIAVVVPRPKKFVPAPRTVAELRLPPPPVLQREPVKVLPPTGISKSRPQEPRRTAPRQLDQNAQLKLERRPPSATAQLPSAPALEPSAVAQPAAPLPSPAVSAMQSSAPAKGVLGGVAGGAFAPRAALGRVRPPADGVLLGLNLALHYRLLARKPDGREAEIAPATPLATGTPVRLSLEASDRGFLYVLERTSGNSWRTLFSTPAEAQRIYLVPSEGTLRYYEPGPREFLVLLTRQPQPQVAAADPDRLQALVAQAKQENAKRRQTMYAVSVDAVTPSQQVAADIVLNFR